VAAAAAATTVVKEVVEAATTTPRRWDRFPIQHLFQINSTCLFLTTFCPLQAVVNALVIIVFFTVMTFVIVLLYKVHVLLIIFVTRPRTEIMLFLQI
jgi:hypothetical protein